MSSNKHLSSSEIKLIEARTKEVISLNVGKPQLSKEVNVSSMDNPQ